MTPLLCALSLLAAYAWVLVQDEQRVSMSGSVKDDLEPARKLLKELGPGYLWFRHAGKQYVVRDGKFLQQVLKVAEGDPAVEAHEARLEEQDHDLERQQQKIDRHEAAIEEWEDQGRSDELRKARQDLQRAQQELSRLQERLGREEERLGRIEEKRSKKTDKAVAALIAKALHDGLAREVR